MDNLSLIYLSWSTLLHLLYLWLAPAHTIQPYTKKVACFYFSLIFNTCSPGDTLSSCNEGIGVYHVFIYWCYLPVVLLLLSLPISSWSLSVWVPCMFALVAPLVQHEVQWLFGHFQLWICFLNIPWRPILILPVPQCSHIMLLSPRILASQARIPCLVLCRRGRHSLPGRCGWCWPHYWTCFLRRGLLSTLFAWRRGWWNMWESSFNRPSCWLGGSCTSSFLLLWNVFWHTF